MLRALAFLCSLVSLWLSWQFGMWYLAWIAWVPLFYLCEEQSLRYVVLKFFSLGFLSYLLLMSWLIPTTVVGWILISAYIAFYFSCFGVAFFMGKIDL